MALELKNRSKRWIYGVRVEGVGDDSTASKGLIVTLGRVPTSSSLDYEFVESMVRAPDSVGIQVDPESGRVRGESLDVEIAANDRVAKLLLAYQRTSLHTSGADNSSDITIAGPTLSVGDTLWIGDEALRVTAVGAASGGGTNYSVDRGLFGTAESDQEGRLVYLDRTPYLRFRRVEFVVFDEAFDTLTVIETGYLDRISTPDVTRIRLEIQSVIGLLSRATINRGAGELRAALSQIVEEPASARGWVRLSDDRVQAASATGRIWFSDTKFLFSANRSTGATPERLDVSTTSTLGAPRPDPEAVDLDDALAQIFVVTDNRLTSSSRDLGASADQDTYQIWRHAVALALGFLRAGADDVGASDYAAAWGGAWGVGLPGSMVDEDAFIAVMESTPEALVDHLVLGWSGDTIRVSDLIASTLLRPRGLVLADDGKGVLTVARMGMASVLDFAAADTVEALPPRLEFDPRIERAYSSVEAEIGELPWRKPDRITITSQSGQTKDSTRRAVLDIERTTSLDFSTLRRGTDVFVDLLALILEGQEAAPRLRIDVLPSDVSGADYPIGGWLKIEVPETHQPWMVGTDGSRIDWDVDNGIFVGQIVGRRQRFDPPKVELTLLLQNLRIGQLVRLRAPGAVVVSNSGSDITVEAGAFHDGSADASFFEVNDKVDLVEADGAPLSPPESSLNVTGVAGNVITLSGLGTVPTAGQVLRLSDAATYGAGGDPLGIGSRNYAYIADESTQTVDGEEADIYG